MANYLDILSETIRNNWDSPALTDFYLTEDGSAQDTSRGNHYTYGEMYAEIVRVADLLAKLGLQKGDNIAICGTNSSHWVIAYLAIAKMQGVSVTIMHTLQPKQIAQMVDFSDAKALFTDEDLWCELKCQSMPQVQHVMGLDDWSVLFGEKQIINNKLPISNDQCQFVHGEADELAMICFTSGSSGRPKGVMLSFLSLTANVKFLFKELQLALGKNIISFLPLAHIYGLYNGLLRPLCLGMHIYTLCDMRSLHNMMTCYAMISPFFAVLVPKLIDDLVARMDHQDAVSIQSKIVELFGGKVYEFSIGGASLNVHTEELLMNSNLPLGKGYGMTECGPLIAVASTRQKQYKLISVGIVVPSLAARIASNGEILVKGENVMLGYYKDPEATAQKIDKEGWLHTGDKGHLDEDGYLYVEGRLEQDIIVLPNGENIRPDNIEALINALPEVKESIVLARDGKLVARVVVPPSLLGEGKGVRLSVLRTVNPLLPLFSQLYDVEITDVPLQRTEKQTLKRYLHK